MEAKNILRDALSLSPAERLFIIEALSKSLNEPDSNIDSFWKDEVEKRYEDCVNGKIKTIAYDDISRK